MSCKVFFPENDVAFTTSGPAFLHACAAFKISAKFWPNKKLSIGALSAAFLLMTLIDGLVNVLRVKDKRK